MSSLYKVTEIEGKGLGCVAIVDIKKGSLILMENPQLCVEITEEKGSIWIKRLLKSFYGMSKTDQLEYMTLHNSFNNFKNLKIVRRSMKEKLKLQSLKLAKSNKIQKKQRKFSKFSAFVLPINFRGVFASKWLDLTIHANLMQWLRI